MSLKFDHVFQLKVALKGIRPPIWRRVEVPCTYSFWDLHVAIQDAMGWLDCHLHEFRMWVPLTDFEARIGLPIDDGFDSEEADTLPGWKIPVAELFTHSNPKAAYLYDFGDGWEHTVTLESIFPRPKGVEYPRCTAGRRACPPEDCGGVCGYQGLLEAVQNPSHEQHNELLEWIGGSFNPERFDIGAVSFDNPEERFYHTFPRLRP